MKDPSLIYDREWFTQFPPLQPEFRDFADALWEVFHPPSVLDVGCGPGMVIERLFERGAHVRGLEGSIYGINIASDLIRPFIRHWDITQGWSGEERELVICTEVAEHLEAQHADGLVKLLADAVTDNGHIYFTAAPPGQGGHDHVNEQPMQYWLEKFSPYGLIPNWNLTEKVHLAMRALRPEWAQVWLFNNAVVLHR